MVDVQAILDRYNGQAVEAEDPSNKDQCMDWAFKYCDELNIPRETIRHLRAYEAWTLPNNLTLQYFDYIPNTANGVPMLGSILLFGTGVGVSGHISVAQRGDVNSVRSLDQNWNGHSYCEYISHPYDNILGWLYPKVLKPVDTCPTDRDINWNIVTQLGTALGVVVNPSNKPQIIIDGIAQIKNMQEMIKGLEEQVSNFNKQLIAATTPPITPPVQVPTQPQTPYIPSIQPKPNAPTNPSSVDSNSSALLSALQKFINKYFKKKK